MLKTRLALMILAALFAAAAAAVVLAASGSVFASVGIGEISARATRLR